MRLVRKIGINIVYVGLLLFYTFKRPSTPRWAKTTIIGAIGYLISPFDLFSDFIPFIGYTDDLGVLILAFIAVSLYINTEVKRKAKVKLNDWFGTYDKGQLIN
jgi:uncharacterized membrane protein YkvA (DUF1232 family)